MQKRWSIIGVMLLVMVLAACSGPSEIEEASDALSQTYSVTLGTMGTVGFDYPRGWIVTNQDGLITAATRIGLLASETFNSGDVLVFFNFVPASALENMSIPEGSSPVMAMINQFNQGERGQILPDPTAIDLDGKAAALSTGTTNLMADIQADIIVIAVEIDNGYGILTGYTPQGELSALETTFKAVAVSMTITP